MDLPQGLTLVMVAECDCIRLMIIILLLLMFVIVGFEDGYWVLKIGGLEALTDCFSKIVDKTFGLF